MPEDRLNLAYWIFFLMGLGMLFPWNAFITAQDYFFQRLCTSPYKYMFMNCFTLSFTSCNALGLVLCIRYQHLFSPRRRVDVPLMFMAVLFSTVTVMVLFPDLDQTVFFVSTLIIVMASGLFTAVLQGGVFGIASALPQKYTQAIMGGQGLAGITISLCSLITKIVVKGDTTECGSPYSDVKMSTLAYFGFSSAVLVICIFGFYVLESLDFYKHHQKNPSQTINSEDEGSGGFLTHGNEDPNELDFDETPSTNTSKLIPHIDSSSVEVSGTKDGGLTFAKFKEVFGHVKVQALSVFSVFAVTLLIFPSTTVQIQSNSSDRVFLELWIPLSFLNFNLFDFLGRILAGCVVYPCHPKTLWIPTAARLVFPVLFLLCNTGETGWLPNVLNADFYPIVIMALFALSNGYLGSVLMMTGPSMTTKVEDKGTAATIMATLLTFGLLFGSLSSFLLLLQ
jgi:equilibrative nucleoside transporter 1/2/3